MNEEPIRLVRTTPPTPPGLQEAFAASLAKIAHHADFSVLMRNNRSIGTDRDRAAGARWIGQRLGSVPHAERVITTNGTQSALLLALVGAVGTGIVLVETLSYYGFQRIAQRIGIDVRAVAMDADGALPDALEDACRALKPKALFLTPTLHNPTAHVMSLERRLVIAEVARHHGVAIIEDDVYGMLPSMCPPPIAALAPDIVWYATGLAKCIAPGLRTGYLAAPSTAQAAALSTALDGTSIWNVSPVSAEISNEWIETGTALRLCEAVRTEVADRQRIASRWLANLEFTTHPEALHIWLRLPAAWRLTEFIARMATKNVILRPGTMFALRPQDRPNACRVVLSCVNDTATLETALQRIRDTIEERVCIAAC